MYELLHNWARVGLFTDPARAYWFAHEMGFWHVVVRLTDDIAEVVPW